MFLRKNKKNIHNVVDKRFEVCYTIISPQCGRLGGGIMGDIITLRGVVFSRYKTLEDFAKAIGWKRNKASRIINGIQQPDIDDIIELTKVL